MGGNAPGRRQGSLSGKNDASPAGTQFAKVTLRLTVGTAERKGVGSAMRRISSGPDFHGGGK